MPADTFTLVIDVNELVGGAASSKGTLTIRYQGTAQYAIFDGDDLRALDAFSGKRNGYEPPSVSSGYTVDLPTDVASGGDHEASLVGYDVTWRSEHATVRATFKARAAGSTWKISQLTNPETIPVAESAANADRAEAAADSAATDADRAETAASTAEQVSGLTGEDDAVALLINTPSSDTGAALSATYASLAARPVSAHTYGVRADGTDQSAELHAAFDAAEVAGGGTVVELPPGVVTVEGGFSLGGYSSGPVGHGCSSSGPGSATLAKGSALKAINQTGPVLDFTGFVWPTNFLARIRIGGFTLQGDGTAGATKKGLLIPSLALGAHLFDINILDTGGSGFDITDLYFSIAERLSCDDPVDCVANNVPYARLAGINGSTVHILLRSRAGTTVASVPAAGALLVEDTASDLHDAEVHPEFEALCAPTDTSLMVVEGRNVVIDNPKFFDCFKVSGATNTSHIRMIAGGTGNLVRGVIPARNTVPTAIDYGVDLQSNGHRVEGVKAYRTHQVRVASGVEGCTVILGGGWSPQTSDQVAIEDNSGSDRNTLIDFTTGVIKFGSMSSIPRLSGIGSLAMRTVEATVAGGTSLFNCNNGTHVRWTLTANGTIGAPSNPVKGMRVTLQLVQDATGSRTMGWNAVWKFAGGAAPTLSTAPGAVDVFEFTYDGANWRELGRSLGT